MTTLASTCCRPYSLLRMIIGQCFGDLNARFPFLNDMHSYSLFKQYLIVTVYCALHNFIHMYNQSDVLFDA